ncbi:MAG: DsbC family protein [Methylococcales bacterium]|nr:DsbC family protein [Methylococcales bacterium]
MRNVFKLVLLSILGSVNAVNADEAAVRQAMTKIIPTVKIDSIKPSEVKGLFEVIVGVNIYYVSENGKYLLAGQLIDVATSKDLTKERLNSARILAINSLGESKMVIYKPKISKYTVSIFTDIDCGYCRKLHSEIDQYLAEGITIRYMFFPRAGKGSESYDKAVSVWCSADRNAALTAAKKDQSLPTKTCDNPIDEHMKLVNDFGLNGTPTIVSENGSLYPGYLPPKQLFATLEQEKLTK